MVLVEYWGCGVRHVQLLLLAICSIVGAIHMKTMESAIMMVEKDTRLNNFTLFDDDFCQKVKNWTEDQKFILKNAWCVPRFLASLLAGLYTTRWNLKYFLLVNFALLSIQSYVIPFVVKKIAFDYLLALVYCQGFFYGMISPVTTAILARWTPHMEVGRTASFILSSRFLGYFFVYILAIFLSTSLAGWHTLFYIVGNLGLLWCVAWFTFGFQDPKDCFYLSSKEKLFIFSNIPSINPEIHSKSRPIPWQKIFTSVPICSVFCAHATTTWIFEFMADTSMPSDFLYTHNGYQRMMTLQLQYLVPAALPPLQLAIAFIVDATLGKNMAPLSHVRKTCNSIGSWGSTVILFWLCYDPIGGLETFCFSSLLFANIFHFLGSALAYYDFTRDYSGLLQGLVDFISLIPLAYYIPLMNPNFDFKDDYKTFETCFQNIWYVAAISSFIGNFIYIILSSEEKKLKSDPNVKRVSHVETTLT